MCRWLGVSPSGFFSWRIRKLCATKIRRRELLALVQWSFDRSHQTYGYRRIHADLNRRGEPVGLDLVREIMGELGLVPCQPRPWRTTTTPGEDGEIVDRVNRDFTATGPGKILVGDITYIHTWQGFVYLATVIDCYSKMVIGWAMADPPPPRSGGRCPQKTGLVIDALNMARRNHVLDKDCVFHSDRGSQYTSTQLREYLNDREMQGSMGRTGVCWDNAMAESFFAALKNELIYRTSFPTHNKARKAVASYIEIFYNRQRLHSGIGYQTPFEVHTDHQLTQTAA
jgi:putative transposase